MIFKKKKNKPDPNSDSKRCESINCPTPDVVYPKDKYFTLDGKILCEFCYTRQLSETAVEVDYDRPKTKKTAQVETSRISSKPVQWDFSPTSKSNLQRIGPSSSNEKYEEEVTRWKEILETVGMPVEYTSIKSIIKFSKSSNTRVIKTSGGALLLSIISLHEHEIKVEEQSIQAKLFNTKVEKSEIFKVSDISEKLKNWIVKNTLSEGSEVPKDQVLRITHITEGNIITLEELSNEPLDIDLHSLLFELGRYFYFLNFIGCSDSDQCLLVQSEDQVTFYNTSFNFAEKTFTNVKETLHQLYSQIPFILDESYHESFIEGTNKQQQALETILTDDKETKDLILNFFEQNNVVYETNNALPSIKSFL